MVAPTFESARVCVQRRTPRPPEIPEWAERAANDSVFPAEINVGPEFDYEVVAWPPGTVDGGLLPRIGDVLTLPGYDQPFRVVDRALHWPAPSTAEARRGEVRVDLIVQEEQAAWAATHKFGRPGEAEIRTEGRWLEGTLARFETRDSRKLDNDGRPLHRYMSLGFDIPGVGRLPAYIAVVWQVRAMFPGAEPGRHDQDRADQAELTANLALGQRFEVNVVPDQDSRSQGRLMIREVRALRRPEPADLANTWDNEAQEITDNLWGEV